MLYCLYMFICLCILGKTCRSWQVKTVQKEVEKDEPIECGRVETGAKMSIFYWRGLPRFLIRSVRILCCDLI